MAGMFEPLGSQFYTGKYYDSFPTLDTAPMGVKFRYEKASDQAATYSQPIRNLVTRKKTLTISTTAPISWKVGAYVLTQDGRMWTIMEWTEDTPVNPQSAFFLKRKMETAALSLVEADNPLGLKV